METLKDELERAIPHLPVEHLGVETLVGEGRRAVRRRRAVVGATGGLVAAGLVVALGALAPGGPTTTAEDPPVATAPASTSTSPATVGPRDIDVDELALRLDTLLEVVSACGADAGTERFEVTAQVARDGWVAKELACGPDVVRVLEGHGEAVVGRFDPDEVDSLAVWAEANAGRLLR